MSIKIIFKWELYGQMELEFEFKDEGGGIGRSDQVLFCSRFRVRRNYTTSGKGDKHDRPSQKTKKKRT